MVLREKVLVNTGGPDVGKTTALSSILKLLLARGQPGHGYLSQDELYHHAFELILCAGRYQARLAWTAR
jgi:hypothetical protein